MNESNSIVIFTKAALMLAEADTIQKARELKNLALTAMDWAKRKDMGEAAIQHCRSYALEAERKMGEMLKATERAKPGPDKKDRLPEGTEPPTLAELGLTKRESSEAQMLADLPEAEFEEIKTGKKTKSRAKKEKNIQVRKKRLIEETKAAMIERPVLHALDCMKHLAEVPPIDLLLTDPPYFTEGDYTAQVSAYLERVKPMGQAYVFASADPAEVAAYLSMDSHHMTLAQILVWNYNNTGQRQPNDRYNSNYQLIFYYRGPDAPAINKPGDGTHQYACQTINAPDGRIGDRFHEWQKPTALIERLIRNSSRVGDFVFDPFAGTGTTIIAAATLGRKTAGCEIDKANVKICIERGCIHES
jgi:hypothetical protein